MIRLSIAFVFALVLLYVWTPLLALDGAIVDLSDVMRSRSPHQLWNQQETSVKEKLILNWLDAFVHSVDTQDTGRLSSLAKLLCAVEPWTSGKLALDEQIQKTIWSNIQAFDVNSEEYKWLDCAAVNRTDYYKSNAISPVSEIRSSMCADIPVSQSHTGTLEFFRSKEADIQKIDEEILEGMLGASSLEDAAKLKRSFYPLRNALRITLLKSATAVRELSAGNRVAAKKEFKDLSEFLKLVDETTNYRNVRNGWRMANDIRFYRELYSWMAKQQQSAEILKDAFLGWPGIAAKEGTPSYAPEGIKQEAIASGDSDYSDMIYIERLFPGAQLFPKSRKDPGAECAAWRRRMYDPRELSKKTQMCARQHPKIENSSDLRDFDACILEFEATDWRVQFATVDPESLELAKSNVDSLITLVLDSIGGLADPELLTELGAKLRGYQAIKLADGRLRITTENLFSTSEIDLIKSAFASSRHLSVDILPLFARPRLY